MTSPWAVGARKWGCLLVALASVVACEGRGPAKPPLGTVHGRVTLKGKPIERGTVRFESVVPGATLLAALGPGGAYEVRTYEGLGIAPGEYRVSISPVGIGTGADKAIPLLAGAPKQPKPKNPPLQIPEQYQKTSSSGLKVTVAPGENQSFDFELAP